MNKEEELRTKLKMFLQNRMSKQETDYGMDLMDEYTRRVAKNSIRWMDTTKNIDLTRTYLDFLR